MDIRYRFRHFFSVWLLSFYLTAAVSSAAEPPMTLDTPEEAMQAFCQTIAAADFESALELFSYREQAAQPADFSAFIQRLRLIDINTPLPPEMSQYTSLNQPLIKARMAVSLKYFVMTILLTGQYDDFLRSGSLLFMQASAEPAAQYMAAIDPARLAGLKIVQIHSISDDSPYFPEMLKESWKIMESSMRQRAEVEELRYCLVLYEFEGKHFGTIHLLGKYAGVWKIIELFDSRAKPLEVVDPEVFLGGE